MLLNYFSLYIYISYIYQSIITGISIKDYHSKYLLGIWLMSSVIIVNLFCNDIRAMIILTKVDVITGLDDLMSRDVNILVNRWSYEYNRMKNVSK